MQQLQSPDAASGAFDFDFVLDLRDDGVSVHRQNVFSHKVTNVTVLVIQRGDGIVDQSQIAEGVTFERFGDRVEPACAGGR